ncbi:acetylesterase [Mobilitalea sibirica]|uniref:Acetylesterase n=1 Tax=Mobilitalea sibirica TaxID=1462919 RepID=A0A8J7KXU9_9FIRM|nr:alpha/beta hydrolase-fold protein [Mobilitalea sibirica]MBH1942267.1 acetylesterase [Mobilitalea sibirica]
MAVVNITFYSFSLRRNVSFCALIPTTRNNSLMSGTINANIECKTLYMLHGYGGDCHDYLHIPELQILSEEYNLAFIYPSGENSFYLEGVDKSENFSSFIGKELVEVTRSMFRLSDRREDTFIGGISMGGYGAMINGLRYSDTFSKIISLSGAYIEINIADKGEFIPDHVSDADYQNRIFQDPKKLRFSDKDPRYCMEALIKSKKKIPEIYFVCGEKDFLIEPNRKLHTFMQENNIEHYYEEGDGVHDWVYWKKHLEHSVRWLVC